MGDPSQGLKRLLAAFDKLEVPYLIGGSVASSFYGPPRTTMDVDLVADLPAESIEEFVRILGSDFYADADMIREALRRKRAFNLIHLSSSYKFDVFPLREDAYSRTSFARRAYQPIRAVGAEPVECAIASAEDTILRKLEWYRSGGESSDRQWNDLRGVLRAMNGKLDIAYMREWAKFLKVDDLLERLLAE